MFELFKDALPLIFALPASAFVAPIIGGDLKKLKDIHRFPFVVGSTVIVYGIFVVFHLLIHPCLAFWPWISLLEFALVGAVCIYALFSNSPDNQTDYLFRFFTFTVSTGLALAAISNLLYANDRVFLFPEDYQSDRIQLFTNDESHSLIIPLKKTVLGKEFFIMRYEDLLNVDKIFGYGSENGMFDDFGYLEPYSFGGYKTQIALSQP